MSYIPKTAVTLFVGFLINCITIYVWPLVFIKRQIETPIYMGITIFFNNFGKSMPLILLTSLIFIVKFLAALSMLKLLPLTTLKAFLVGFAQNVITEYLGLIIFTAATIFIKDKNELISNNLIPLDD